MLNKKYITGKREPFFELASDYITEKSLILDVGSGNGAFARFLNRNDVYNFDGNPDTIKSIASVFPNSFCGRLPELPFEDQQFDFIHASHIIEHLEPRELYEFLKEADRVLKVNGFLTISAPMLWSGFYNDLSHVKPYNPFVFMRYLCTKKSKNTTRAVISDSYTVEKLQYRYCKVSYNDTIIIHPNRFFEKIARGFKWFFYKFGYQKIQTSGFTIILKKNAPTSDHS